MINKGIHIEKHLFYQKHSKCEVQEEVSTGWFHLTIKRKVLVQNLLPEH